MKSKKEKKLRTKNAAYKIKNIKLTGRNRGKWTSW